MTDTPPNEDELLLVGTISGPFGVRGQVKMYTVTTHPEHLGRVRTVFVGEEYTPMRLQRAQMHKHNLVILTLHGVGNRNAAEELRNAEVFIKDTDAAPLEEGEYFLHDLPGMTVETTAGEQVGSVKDVLETGANDVLVVGRTEGGDVLVPMIHDIVKTLDLAAKRIVIEPLPGLLDE
jgi:16S rRNA processing protein RimM